MMRILTAVTLFGTITICAAQESVPDIAVVTTWRELATLPVLPLADGGEVRVGIQTQAAPVGSGVAIFVLFEQRHEKPSQAIDATSYVPVRVTWTHNAPVPTLASVVQELQQVQFTKGMHLHAQVMPLVHAGTYSVHVRDQDERVIAKTTVTATTAAYHRWSSLHMPDRPAHEREQEDEPWDCDLDIVAGPGHAVTVAGSDGNSWMWLEAVHHEDVLTGNAADIALPIADPVLVDQRVTIAATRMAVTVFVPAACKFHFITGGGASEQVLVRWWRNGEPWEPRPSEMLAMMGNGLSRIAKGDLHLRFHIEPGSLPEGERIEIQLLLCTTGSISASEEFLTLATPVFDVPPGSLPMLLTPRCEVR